MANCQVLKMLHLGQNLKLTYSVVTVIKQRINQIVLVGNIRASAYHRTSKQSGIPKKEFKKMKFDSERINNSESNWMIKKMTNRVLTEALMKENEEFKERIEVFSEEDSFGTLSECSTNKHIENLDRNRRFELREKKESISWKSDKKSFRRDENKSDYNFEAKRHIRSNYMLDSNMKNDEEWFSRDCTKSDHNLEAKRHSRSNYKLDSNMKNDEKWFNRDQTNFDKHYQAKRHPSSSHKLSFNDGREIVKGKQSTKRKLTNDTCERIQQHFKFHSQISSSDGNENRGKVGPKLMYDKINNRTSGKTGNKYSKKTKDIFSDSFGTLNMDNEIKFLTYEEEKSMGLTEGDDGDEKPHRRLVTLRDGHNHNFYARKICKMDKQGKVNEAISILEDKMLVEDRVQPTLYEFSLVISICGRVGYTAKAFSLFNKMKKMALQPGDHTYTALFNACANSPLEGDGLKRAKNLRELMAIKDYRPNLVTYKAMIKAFGFCGDMKTAFLIADEASRKFKLDTEFFCHLLISAISDKEAGFRHAIEIWRMMRGKGVRPTIFLYNLMLRAVGECGIGDEEFIKDLIPSDQTAVHTSLQIKSGEDLNENSEIKSGDTIESNLEIMSTETIDRSSQITSSATINTSSQITSSATIDTSSQITSSDTFDTGSQIISSDISSTSLTSSDTIETSSQIISSDTSNTSLISSVVIDSILTSSDTIDSSSQMELISETSDISSSTSSAVSLKESNLEWWQYDLTTNKPKTRYVNKPVNNTNLSHHLAVDVPDILNPKEKYTKVVSLNKIKTGEDRMMLLGGMDRYLRHMDADGVTANITTYNQLLVVLPQTEEAELELFDRMETAGVKPDIAIFNLLILRRFLRKAYLKVWEVKKLIEKNNLTCDMRTYQLLGNSCVNIPSAVKFLKTMEEAGFEPDIKVMTSLLYASYMDFEYKMFVLKQMEKYSIQPNKQFLEKMEKHLIRARQLLNTKQEDSIMSKQFTKLRHYYDDWLQRVEIQSEEHPWHSFSKAKDKESSFIAV